MIDYSHDQGVYIPLEQVDFLYCIYCNATPWLLGGFCCDKSTCTYLQKTINSIQFNSIIKEMKNFLIRIARGKVDGEALEHCDIIDNDRINTNHKNEPTNTETPQI